MSSENVDIPTELELRLTSNLLEARRELLDAAFVATYERLGVPLNDEAEALFDKELDVLYRASLVASRPARLSKTTAMRLRAVCLLHRSGAT